MLRLNGKDEPISSVVGETTLIHAETTLIHGETTLLRAESTLLNSFMFARSGVMPTLAAGATVSPNKETAWNLTSVMLAVVASGALTSAFRIEAVNVENVTYSGIHELVLYEGTAGATELGRCRMTLSTIANSGYSQFSLPTKSIVANKSIKAKIAGGATNAAITFSIQYRIV